MPNHTANQAALRADGHSMRVYLTALVGSAVWSGTISATPAPVSALNLSVTGSSGAHTAVRRGMRVVIKTSGGAYKGTLTVRHAGTISSTNLPVREFSRGHVEAVSGDVFEVWNDFQLVDRLVAATEGFEPDSEVYTDQNSLLAPVGTSGGSWAGAVDDGQTYATIALVGAAYTIDEDSGGTVTYLTTLPSGVVFAPGSGATDASPTIRADGGYHVIERTFTDASNGKTETQYVVVSVSDADHPPYDVPDEITISGERGRGWSVNGLRLFGDTSLAALPDRCPMILWCSERINGVKQSFGVKATGRSHILCVGYLRRDTGKIDGRGNEHTFDIIAPLTRLAELPGFSKVMLRDAAPDAWSEIEGLTIKRAIVQLLRYYTNALQLFDLLDDGFSDCAYSTLYLQKQVPVEQVRELASSRDGSVNADATGRLELQQLLELEPLASRAGVTRTITLGLDDIIVDKTEGIGVEIIREHDRRVETFRMRGYTAGETADDNNAIFAKWAASPGTGTQSSIVERAIADNVPSLYERTAMRGAWEDGVYINAADGNKAYQAPEVRLTLPGSYRGLFQFYREYVLLDLDETTNPRGIDLRVFLFIVTGVEIQIKRGTARVVLTLRAATYAEGAVDDTPATEVYPPTEPPITYPPVVVTPPYDGTGLHANAPTLALILSDGTLKRTANANSAYPNWSSVNLTALANWVGSEATEFVVDAFSPKYLGTGVGINGWITSANVPGGTILRITDIAGSPALTNQKTITTGVGRSVNAQFERGVQGWGIVAVSSGGGTEVSYTTDGANWTTVSVDAYYDTFGEQWRCGLTLNPHTAGEAYLSTLLATGASNAATPPSGVILKTTNYGASWVSTGLSVGYMKAGAILMPYAAPDYLFHGYRTGTGTSVYRLYRSRLSTGAQVDISPVVSGAVYGVGGNETNRQLSAADDDANTLIFIGTSVSANKRGIFLTRNALAAAPTWTELSAPVTIGTELYQGVYCVGRNAAYFFGGNGNIGYWDGGATIRSLKGDLSTSAAVVGICGL